MNNIYTDTQLKQALAKMLPDNYYFDRDGELCEGTRIAGNMRAFFGKVKDTELLHLCWLVEETLNGSDLNGLWALYRIELGNAGATGIFTKIHATWQQRVVALCKVKGIEI